MNDSLTATSNPRLIAFYLPQFHPIAENDQWWGKGFTEWTNVTRAQPLFPGHYQPHLPADLGFYDLRVRETRLEQIKLAKQHGIDGFCYHYYWFSGTRLLFEPLEQMLRDSEIDMPFCLCWANENWTRKWDGGDKDILIAQRHLPEDDLGFITSVEPFLRDRRYMLLAGKPILIVYSPQSLSEPHRTTDSWREYCRSVGIGEVHLCAALTQGNYSYAEMGFDSGVEFPPHNIKVGDWNHLPRFRAPFYGKVKRFDEIAQSFLDRADPQSNVFMSVFPSWDNTARAQSRAVIVLNGTPNNYERWLSESIKKTKALYPDQDRLVFINAWNEWAEGCHLEPDLRYGHGFLEATLRAKSGTSTVGDFDHSDEYPDREDPSSENDLSPHRRFVVQRLLTSLWPAYRNIAGELEFRSRARHSAAIEGSPGVTAHPDDPLAAFSGWVLIDEVLIRIRRKTKSIPKKFSPGRRFPPSIEKGSAAPRLNNETNLDAFSGWILVDEVLYRVKGRIRSLVRARPEKPNTLNSNK